MTSHCSGDAYICEMNTKVITHIPIVVGGCLPCFILTTLMSNTERESNVIENYWTEPIFYPSIFASYRAPPDESMCWAASALQMKHMCSRLTLVTEFCLLFLLLACSTRQPAVLFKAGQTSMLPFVHIIHHRVSDAQRLIAAQLHLFPLIFFLLPHSPIFLPHYIALFLCPHLFSSLSFIMLLSLTVCQTVLSIIQ